MSDQGAAGPIITPPGPPGEAQAPGIRILAQFVRDLSFENPRAPESLRTQGVQPQIDLGVEMSARARDDGFYEVDLKLTAAATHEEQPIFTAELLYGGLFQISGIPEEAMEQVLLIECPRFLFPFARKVIADATSDGGFPPFLVDPIDFSMVYAARKAQMETASGGEA